MSVSVREVAARAGVSVGTVSNVLNRRDAVRPATVERVERAIDELGYVPNDAARQLRAGQSTTIALVVLDIGNPFFTDVARGAEERAVESGYTLLLANSDDSVERESAHLDQFERQRVAGVLVVPTSSAQPRVSQLRAHGVPVVLVDRGTADATLASVAVDDVEGGRLAAEHLLSQGRRQLVFVGGPEDLPQVQDRSAGAHSAVGAVEGAGILHVPTAALTLDDGMSAGAEVRALVRAGRCDAVLAANDLLAIGVQQALLSGPDPVGIPREVALVGYDDISFAAAAVVPITSVRQPRRVMGATAVDLLLREAGLAPAAAREHVVFQPELVVRASSTVPAPPDAPA
ncbi:LacI family DNA-binding transcriptional regulator [Demequina muriae]|uniref:LacI family DNA-binding transcriptional regulator n=1 Tax=Demequina muriae TaxID=3051664 RepID=A0ABT8GJF8_9MICO|nr:LacI family DNA-binding transcriptional regulator [Demequina sp. EGI L300058]MDN4481081.1 LacI family DNA-binding transcriptional regulator [Demequina sp. EGI L300058]